MSNKKPDWLAISVALSALAVVVTWLNTKPFRGMTQEEEPTPPPPKQ